MSGCQGDDECASVAAQGGTPPYTYLWNTGLTSSTITNLAPGQYIVTITDSNGCAQQNAVAINSFDCSLSITVNSTDVLCNGDANGTASVVVSGGDGPFSYLWSTGDTTASINGLAVGNYKLTLTDDNNCVTIEPFFIEEPNHLAVAGSVQNVSCFDGDDASINIQMSGGTSPYSYNWLDGITTEDRTNLAIGNYWLTVTDDNGCTKIQLFQISQPDSLQLELVSKNDVDCNGSATGSATVVADGGTLPYSYLWNDAAAQTSSTATQLSAGNYTVVLTDANGCERTVNVVIGEPSAVQIALDQVNPEIGTAGNGSIQVSVTGGTAPYIYQWFLQGNLIAETEDIFNLATGIYQLQLTDANGCVFILSDIVVEQLTSLGDPTLAARIEMMPNPTNGPLRLHFELEEQSAVQLNLVDVTGRLIEQRAGLLLREGVVELDLSELPAGVYPLRIFVGEKVVEKRIVVIR